MAEPELDARTLAAVDMLRRTGASKFELRYQDDQEPVVWIAMAEHAFKDGPHWDAAAAMNPYRAVFRLCELFIDGGFCKHCQRPTGVTEDIEPMPMEELVCWYAFDPELNVFRRGCEGDT